MEHKKTPEYHAANHIALEDLFENALIGLHIVGPDGLVKRANRADRAPVGLADQPNDYIGHHIGEFHAEDPVVEEILENLLNNRSIINYKADLKTIDGNRAPVSIYSNSNMDGEEFLNTRCFTKVGVEELRDFAKTQSAKEESARDIVAGLDPTERHNRYVELKNFFEEGLVPVRMLDARGIIRWANPAELFAMGYERHPEAYIGQPITRFYANPKAGEQMLELLLSNEPLVEFEVELVRRDGSLYPVTICSNSRIEDGKLVNTRCFTYSVAEALKEQMQRYSWPRNEEMFE